MNLSLHGKTLALTLATVTMAFGCSSSSTASSGGSGGTPTFTEVYNDVMVPHGCNAHHIATGPDDFLDMSTQAKAYTDLVGVKADGPACGSSGLTRVVPGDPSKSLMYLKVSESKPPCGSQMPLLGTPLTSSEQAEISAWITAGAKND
jgi:hypothetical protein